MKKVLLFATVAVFAACNNQPAATVDASAKTTADSTIAEIKSPYEIGYSSKFVMGDPKNAETLLNAHHKGSDWQSTVEWCRSTARIFNWTNDGCIRTRV